MKQSSEQPEARRWSRRDRPTIGITCDVERDSGRIVLRRPYVDAVRRAGGVPYLLPPSVESLPAYLDQCDGFLLTGGDDPRMEAFGEPTHPRATPVHPDRQTFEIALLEAIFRDDQPPLFGICLGMQLMALTRGGRLDQYLPETLATYEAHWGKKTHEIEGSLGMGRILSHHKQAIIDPGAFRVIGRAPDEVIEAIDDPDYPTWCVGVQWHPERTENPALGADLFAQFVDAASAHRRQRLDMLHP